jgi:hypothetical protein
MRAPGEVSGILRLKALGQGSKWIAAELGCARNRGHYTIRTKLHAKGRAPT